MGELTESAIERLRREKAELTAERDGLAAERRQLMQGKYVPVSDLEAAWRVGARHQERADRAEARLVDVHDRVNELAALVQRGDTRHAIRTAVADLRRAVNGGPHGE